MFVIYELCGIGKTELAKSFYIKIVHAANFLAIVRDISNKIKA
jgi:hypothetical protein